MPDWTVKSVPRKIKKSAAVDAARTLGFDPTQVRSLDIDMSSKVVRAEVLVLNEDNQGFADAYKKPVALRIDIEIEP